MSSVLDWWWNATLVTFAIVAAMRVFELAAGRWVSPGVRIAAYCLVFLRLAVPLDTPAPVPLVPAEGFATPELVLPSSSLAVAPSLEPVRAPGPRVETAGTVPRTANPGPDPWWLIYLAGVGVFALWGSRAFVRELNVARTTRASREIDGTRVHVHPTAGPCVVGLWRPRIIVPRDLLSCSPMTQRCVVAHERAHVDGGDVWALLLLRCALVLAWPILPAWYAAARVRALLELRADARAVESFGLDPREFGRALVSLVPIETRSAAMSLSTYRGLRERVAALTSAGSRSVWASASFLAVALMLAACSGRAEISPSISGAVSRLSDTDASEAEACSEDTRWVQLRSSEVVRVVEPRVGWGTPETVRALETIAQRYAGRVDGGVLVVGSLSREGGGHLPPHRTHRDGLEADLLWPVGADGQLDTARAWPMLESVMDSDLVASIQVGYTIQAELHAAASAAGVEPERLESVFQYPRGQATAGTLVQHHAGAVDHTHVRFALP